MAYNMVSNEFYIEECKKEISTKRILEAERLLLYNHFHPVFGQELTIFLTLSHCRILSFLLSNQQQTLGISFFCDFETLHL